MPDAFNASFTKIALHLYCWAGSQKMILAVVSDRTFTSFKKKVKKKKNKNELIWYIVSLLMELIFDVTIGVKIRVRLFFQDIDRLLQWWYDGFNAKGSFWQGFCLLPFRHEQSDEAVPSSSLTHLELFSSPLQTIF